ncbi:hypothetical protein FACS1894104_0130 [Actinomycetota bacterium]|nr:hypothetical protein FACS1894104_0130 [Actinomycetota bacterium]
MNYTLMHKTLPVLELDIDLETTAISRIMDVYQLEHLPVGVEIVDGRPSRRSLNNWWQGRAIPASRSGLRDALQAMRVSSTGLLLLKCQGLSLSDQYWVNSQDKPLNWADINFFENEFSEDVGNALFGSKPHADDINLVSPDNTSDGWLKKKWVIVDGKRVLLKGGSEPFHQEPLNEVIATRIMERLGIAHATYTLAWDGQKPLSACEDFITVNTELVSAWHIYSTFKKSNNHSSYQHYLHCCESLGIPGIVDSLDRMLALDFMVVNADRHFNNFGAIRDAETLEWLGAAPVFDSGTSLWHSQLANLIRLTDKQESKPFNRWHSEQVKRITSLAWLDFKALDDIEDEYAALLEQSIYIDNDRRDRLCQALRYRIEALEKLAANK